MMVSEERAFELMSRMAYERMSGTEEELRCANMLLDEMKSFGLEGKLEEFPVEDSQVEEAELEVLSPYHKVYRVSGYKRSQCTSEGGITADLVYVENALPANLVNVRCKVVLLNGRPGHDTYKALQEAQVAGIITFNGEYDGERDKTDLNVCKLRPMLTDELGRNVAVNTLVWDALEMVQKGADKVRINVQTRDVTRISHNVTAEIKGSEIPDEEILFGGHYDSVRYSTGVYDNAAGSVIVMEMARHFMENPPKRTVKFAFFGSEEEGLLGSKFYSANHDLSRMRLMVNLDVGGAALGANTATMTGVKESVAYLDAFLKSRGYAFKVEQHIQSSDSTPFTDEGVPCANFFRGAAPGAGRMHTRSDTMMFLSPKGVANILYPVRDFADEVVNSVIFPVPREVPPEMREAVDKYYFRKN